MEQMKKEILKGTEPDWRDKNFKEWLRTYCSQYHWDKSVLFSRGMDDDSDGFATPTLKLFLYNTYRRLRSWSPMYKTRMLCQKIFRKNHIADNELWSADY